MTEGLVREKHFSKFINNDLLFVTRVNTNIVYKELNKSRIVKKKNEGVEIKQDKSVFLKDRDGKWMDKPLRLIKATIFQTKKDIYFLTNIQDLQAEEIACIYKQRWDIEVLFNFLKQELNLSHLVSRNDNGIRVMVYMTLILSILIIAYKKLNKLTGFKIPKLKFANEIESDIIREIVILCGGQPSKMKHLFNDS